METTEKKKKVKSRWKIGNKRYPEAELQDIYSIYREQDGWFKGARVYKKTAS